MKKVLTCIECPVGGVAVGKYRACLLIGAIREADKFVGKIRRALTCDPYTLRRRGDIYVIEWALVCKLIAEDEVEYARKLPCRLVERVGVG